MANTERKRKILSPVTKGSVARSVLQAKVEAVSRVETTDLAVGDRVIIRAIGSRESVAGNIVAVSGRGSGKLITIHVIGKGKSLSRNFRVADCKITKIGRSGMSDATLGFLKGSQYAKPSVSVKQVFRAHPRVD